MDKVSGTTLFTLILLLIFAFLLIIIFKFLKKTTISNLPPSPPSLPILGHLLLLNSKQPLHETLHTLSQKFGPIMFLRFGVRRVLVVTSPYAVEECFTKSNDIVLANRPLFALGKYLNYDYTTMGTAPYGHLWHALRRVAASELFSTTHLNSTTRSREHEVKLCCQRIVRESSLLSSRKVELKEKFSELLNNITTMAMIGKRYYGDEIETDDERSAVMFREMVGEMFKLIHTQNVGDFLPVLGWVDFGGTKKKMISLMKRIDEFLDEVIGERRRVGRCGGSGIMVDKLLELQEEVPEVYTDQFIKGLILIMLVAGTETPYSTLEWAMSLLLNNPKTMEKIKNEINTHVGSDHLLQENDLEKLNYLQNFINETLRLYPTLPLLLPHEASKDCKIGGYLVPRGTMLMVNAWAIHRDPVLWDNPEEFMPERFEGRCNQDMQYKMLAFGVGRRMCPGTTLGFRVLGLTLGTLIQAFEWEKIGNEDVDMTAFYGTSMSKLKPLQALCKPRSIMAHFV